MKTLKTLKVLMAALVVAMLVSVFFADNPGAVLGTTVLATVVAVGSIKTANEMKQERHALYEQAQAILNLAKSESRQLTAEERAKYDELDRKMDEMEADIKRLEKDERRAAEYAGKVINERNQQKEDKELEKFSFMRVMRSLASGIQPDAIGGIEGEMLQEARAEAARSGVSLSGFGIPSIILKRAATATGTTTNAGDQGGYMVPTVKVGFIDALLNALVTRGLGVQTLTGLVGNVDIPKKVTTLAAAWEGENTTADETNYLFGKLSLAPRRLAAWTKFSKQLLHQASQDVEAMIIRDLQIAIAQKVEHAIINGTGSANNQPTGILSTSGIGSVPIGATGGALTWEHITKLEKEVGVDNAMTGAMAYLTNSKVIQALKNTKKDSGSGLFLLENDKMINGYPIAVTNLVPSNLTKSTGSDLSAVIFGVWSEYILAQWAGIDIVIDPYSGKKDNYVEVAVNSYWDGGCRHAESFAAVVDATT